ncbi:MAG: 30S ribosomal protein S17 [Gammaproteobacteria bacterium]|nr:30S ribosomal protein S17 [Gammaproteobacteria bacterium]
MNKTAIGKVISDQMNKTVVVQIVRREPHPRYQKIVKRITKLLAHDEAGLCKMGDTVKIAESRPISKHKAWHLVEVVQKAD